MKLKIKEIFSEKEDGVIIILTLGLLALISLLTIAYVNLAVIDKKAAYNYNALHQARMLAQSTAQRAIALSSTQLSTSSARASDVYTFNANEDSDGLAELLQTEIEGKTYCTSADYNVSDGPHWQYIYIPEGNGTDTPIIGRFAYKVIADQGRIDPSAASYNYSTEDGGSINGRPGRDIGEVKLNALGSWFENNESILTQQNEVRWNSFDSIFDVLSISNSDYKDSYKTFFVLDEEPDPEAFWSDNGDLQRESSELFHRFNLARNDWDNINVDSILSQPLPYNSSTSQSAIFSIPWLNNWSSRSSFQSAELCSSQIAANLIDYNDSDTTATTDNENNPTYVGLEKCPYINELQLKVEAQVLTPSSNSGYSVFAGGALAIVAYDDKLELSDGHANGSLEIGGIYGGSVEASGTFSAPAAAYTYNATVTTEILSESQTMPDMPQSLTWYKSEASSTSTSFTGNINLENGGTGKIKITGDNISGSTQVDQGCVVYTTGDIIIDTDFSRSVTLVAEGDVGINANASTGNSPISSSDLTISMTAAVENTLIYALGRVDIDNCNITSTGIIRGNEVEILDCTLSLTDTKVWAVGSAAVKECHGQMTEDDSGTTGSSDYTCNVFLTNAQLELVEMYGESMNGCQAEVTVEGSYNWVFTAQDSEDNIDSQVNFSLEPFNIEIDASADTYSHCSLDLTDSDISPATTISSSLEFDKISIEDFKITSLKVKLTDSNSNLLDFSFIESLSDIETDGKTIYDSTLVTETEEEDEEDEEVGATVTQGYEIDGSLNINPGSMSSSHPFIMQTVSDSEVNVDDIKDWRSNIKYSGTATEIKIKAKSPGQGGTSIEINGTEINLATNTYYTFSGNMSVYLFNSTNKSWKTYGQRTGQWWINIEGDNITIDPDPLSGASYADWEQKWWPDGYDIGDRVLYYGTVYESVINDNYWSPSAYPAGWTEVDLSGSTGDTEDEDEGEEETEEVSRINTVYFNYQVADPRQNLNPGDWGGVNVYNSISEQESELEDENTFGEKNNNWKPGFEEGIDKDLESDSAEPWNVSTAYIRNEPMESPWELGLIHRGAAFQTINLKQYNMGEGMRGGGDQYSDGDANILDQIKMTSENAVYGKINLNTELEEVLEALFEDIPLGSSLSSPGTGGTAINDAEDLSEYTLTANKSKPFYTRAQILRPDRELNSEDIFGVNELYDGTYFTQSNDAAQEEIIGKFINLTKAVAPDEYTIIVVAQTIKDIGGVTLNGVQCETGRYDEGGDLILATQKVVAIAKWDEDTEQFRILRYQYIDEE